VNPAKGTHRPWVYPYKLDDDPALAEERRQRDEGTEDPDIVFDRMETAYFQHCADHASAWLAANATAPEETRDRAFAHVVVNTRLANRSEDRVLPRPSAKELDETYQETRNPLYAFEQIAYALNDSTPSKELFGPINVELTYLSAQMLYNLVNELLLLGQPGYPPATPRNVLKALALFSPGTSAYARRKRRWRDQFGAALEAELVAAGMTARRARAVGFPHITDPRSLRRVSKRVAPRFGPTGEK
jgi:hypothetical protein